MAKGDPYCSVISKVFATTFPGLVKTKCSELVGMVGQLTYDEVVGVFNELANMTNNFHISWMYEGENDSDPVWIEEVRR